jgi:hypothetical protein
MISTVYTPQFATYFVPTYIELLSDLPLEEAVQVRCVCTVFRYLIG